MIRLDKIKKVICLFTGVALLLTGVCMNTYAEDHAGGDNWKVEFNGKKLESTFRSNDIADALYELQPGDSVKFHLDIKNSANFATDWYMTNEVLKSLEDTQKVAVNGGYTYTLKYINKSGETITLYSSDSIGGEKETTAGAGLNEATDSLDEFFYLERLDTNESGSVELYVSLDGESQGNIYQDTAADLQMNFAVEKVTNKETPPSDAPNERTSYKTKHQNNIHTSRVRTGDIMKWGSIAALAVGLILIVLAIVSAKNEREE